MHMTVGTLYQIKQKEWTFLFKVATYLVTFLAFLIPISTTFSFITMYMIALIWIIDSHSKERWQYYCHYPLFKPILIYMGLGSLGLLYTSGDWEASIKSFSHILRLGFIPILAYYLHHQFNQNKKIVIALFVGAMVLTVLLSFLKVYGHFPIGQRSYRHDVFKNHIVISYFMASALLFLCVWMKEFKQKQFFIGISIALIAYYLFFLNTGRIGYIILYTSLAVLAWHRYKIKGAIVSLIGFCIALIAAFYFSDTFSLRIQELYQEYHSYVQENTATSNIIESSVGRRIEFAKNSLTLISQHSIFGHGTGSFGATYQHYFSSQFQTMTNNPHCQYLKTLAEYGLVGLIILSYLFVKQWKLTKALSGSQKILAQGVFLSFFIGCIFNTWLDNFSECYFYCLMTAYFIPSMPPFHYDQMANRNPEQPKSSPL